MTYIAILFGFLGLLTILPLSSAGAFDCNKKCNENLVTCGYDDIRDCYRPFFSECEMKEAICEEFWFYEKRSLLECTASFDFCADFYW